MTSVAAEAISPELVLVCPGLREAAVALLEAAPPRWAMPPRSAPAAAMIEPVRGSLPPVQSLLSSAKVGGWIIGAVISVTAVLTAVADIVR